MSLDEHFAHPDAWPFLLLVPLTVLLLWGFDRARSRKLERAVGPRVTALAAERSGGRRGTRRTLFTAALTLAMIAMLQPLWGEAARVVEQRGVDIVVCLDVSRSMLARDLLPDRLGRARAEIRALAKLADGDRIGLVVFAGDARLLVPLTRDRQTFADLVERATPLSIERGGTDLGAALSAALDALPADAGEHEVVLLLTDGEDHAGRGLRAARLCAERGITVHTVGFGSELGAKIPVDVEGGEAFLRDRSGNEVVTSMSPDTLREMASVTGGGFVDAHAESNALLRVYDDRIEPMARKAFESEERRARKNRYQWPLMAAILLWLWGLCMADRRR
ncbi:MAG: VWA domain-containing protein [Planctomycetota bacterium]